jgi:hypothetical protein
MDLRAGVSMFEPSEGLRRLADFPFALLSWVGDRRLPDQRGGRGPGRRRQRQGHLHGRRPGWRAARPRDQPDRQPHPAAAGLSATTSAATSPSGAACEATATAGSPSAHAAWGWDEATSPSPSTSSGRSASRSATWRGCRRSSADRPPRLSLGWLILRATRLPFLSATFIPCWSAWPSPPGTASSTCTSALLTLVGAAAVHLGLNVANDVFDARLGADEKNVNPTQYSGGSRVIQYGLVSLRGMTSSRPPSTRSRSPVGLVLLWLRPSVELLVIGVARRAAQRSSTPRRPSSSSTAAWARSPRRSASGR